MLSSDGCMFRVLSDVIQGLIKCLCCFSCAGMCDRKLICVHLTQPSPSLNATVTSLTPVWGFLLLNCFTFLSHSGFIVCVDLCLHRAVIMYLYEHLNDISFQMCRDLIEELLVMLSKATVRYCERERQMHSLAEVMLLHEHTIYMSHITHSYTLLLLFY